tara:strand:+ start:322 stop:513 length:192 start_codon:yes stop_codon:yes gene_type:complete
MVLMLSLVFVLGCQEVVEETPTVEPTIQDTADIDDSLAELEDLDALEKELDIDFDELEGYLES